jgi:uncharacterized protein (DUF362 family)
MVREAFQRLGMDAGRFGTKDWNPLGEIIKRGGTVIIKPNLVHDYNHLSPRASGLPREVCEDTECLVTQGAVIRAVTDYVYKAVGPRGTIGIIDLPCIEANFDKVLDISGITHIQRFYDTAVGVDLRVGDLRGLADRDAIGVDLGSEGCLNERAQTNQGWRRFASMYCDEEQMARFHGPGMDKIFVARCVADSDVIISLPKMKTHKIAGVTGALKNFVGVTAHRKSLPHYSKGAVQSGGDEYPTPSLLKRLAAKSVKMRARLNNRLSARMQNLCERACFKILGWKGVNLYRYGWWYGNDTLWRTVLDINRIALYVSAVGKMANVMQRRHFALVDGIVCGEGEGPLAPERKDAGLIIAGANIVAVDAVMCSLMGFDYMKIPLIHNAFKIQSYPLFGFQMGDIEVVSNKDDWSGAPATEITAARFKPAPGWAGHIEK